MRTHGWKQHVDGSIELGTMALRPFPSETPFQRLQCRVDRLEDDVRELRALLTEADARIAALEVGDVSL